jgi:hypothetical protein
VAVLERAEVCAEPKRLLLARSASDALQRARELAA